MKNILWATPSAAGPRTLLTALGLQILVIVASGSWHFFGTPTCHLRIFFYWDTREHNKGHFEVQAWISMDIRWILLPMVVIWLLGASSLASWGTLGRSWDDPGTGTRKDPARSRLGFHGFFHDLGDPF